jgi:hypothetical protein
MTADIVFGALYLALTHHTLIVHVSPSFCVRLPSGQDACLMLWKFVQNIFSAGPSPKSGVGEKMPIGGGVCGAVTISDREAAQPCGAPDRIRSLAQRRASRGATKANCETR